MQPVREAVGRLIDAQALRSAPGRAIRVPRLDRRTADEIWSLRLLLEGEAAARFAARKRPAEARQLYHYTKAMRSLDYGTDLQPTMRALMAWNLALARGSNSVILSGAIQRLRLRYAPFIADGLATDASFDDIFLSFTLHMQDELVMAIEAGDAEAARHLRCADLRSFQRFLYSRKNWRIAC
jgi:DNA-binding GntR family transcriptional regulator